MLQAARSGWARAGESLGLRGRRRPFGIHRDRLPVFVDGEGNVVGDGGGIEVAQAAYEKSANVAAVIDDGAAQFVLRGTIHLRGHDAEIEADIDEDGADRAAAVLRGDLLERGRAFEGGITSRVMQAGGRLFAGVRLARLARA